MESGEQRRITFPSKSPVILPGTTGSHLTFYSTGGKLSLLLVSPHPSACEVLPNKIKAPCQIKRLHKHGVGFLKIGLQKGKPALPLI